MSKSTSSWQKGRCAALAALFVLVAAPAFSQQATPEATPPAKPGATEAAAPAPTAPATPATPAAGTAATARPEDALRERAEAYWKLRIARSPETLRFYPRNAEGRIVGGTHSESGTLRFKTYAIRKVAVEGDRGVVVVDAQGELTGEQAARLEKYQQYLNQSVTEEWIRVDGTWYKKPVEGGLSRFMQKKHDAIKAERAAAEAKEAEAAQAAEAARAASKASPGATPPAPPAPSAAPDSAPSAAQPGTGAAQPQ